MPTYNPDVFPDPGVPVSPISIKTMLNWAPRVLAHVMLWFDPSSTSHLNIGYLSSDPTTVAKQVSYLKTRGVDVALLEWYGTTAHPHAEAALQWKSECEKQGLNFAIGMDGGMFKSWYMPSTTDVNTWATEMMQYVADNFFTSPNYEKTADGRYLMINFGWELVTGLDSGTVLGKFPQAAMLWEHSGGVSKPKSAGAFAWVGLSSTDTETCIENYASSFISATAKSYAANPNLLIMGSLVKGFDDHNRQPGGDPTKSCWDSSQPYRFADEKQGQTLLNAISIYNKSTFKPQYMQIVTFNDHEEGTNFEWGIDSLLTANLTVNNGVLAVSLLGNANIADHTDIIVNGSIVSTFTGSLAQFDLNTLNPTNNQQFICQATVTGKSFFQQKVSNVVTTTAVIVPTQTLQLPVNTTVTIPVTTSTTVSLNTQAQVQINTQAPVQLNTQVTIPISSNVVVPVFGTADGLAVSGNVSIPVQQDAQIPVNANVQIPVQETLMVPVVQDVTIPINTTVQVPLNQTATVTINTQTVWQ